MTVQATDMLLVRGQYLSLADFPLEPYLARLPKRLRPVMAKWSTANYRGYVALWEIRDGMLWLKDVDAWIEFGGEVVRATLETFLPHRKGPIAATWFSDTLHCPDGRLRSYSLIHGIGQQDTERQRQFDIHRGRVMDEWVIHLPPSPIFYRLLPDGSRQHVDGYLSRRGWRPHPDGPPDPFPAGAPVEPWRHWGDPDHDVLPPPEQQWGDPGWRNHPPV